MRSPFVVFIALVFGVAQPALAQSEETGPARSGVSTDAFETGLVHTRDVTLYEFTAPAFNKVGRNMLEATPIQSSTGRPVSGNVKGEWDLKLATRQAEVGAPCEVDSVEVTVVNKITLPRWTNVEEAARPDRVKWERYITALEACQEGHVAINLDIARAVRDEIMALEPAEDCEAGTADARLAVAVVEARFETAHQDYARETNDGRTLGATLGRQFD